MFAVFDYASFQSIWYWVLTIAVWTQICHRTLGVPYDMILRADRLPDVADDVDVLAKVGAARLAAIHRVLGPWLAAVGGFVLAALAVLGVSHHYEVAQAALLLLVPMAFVGLQTLRLGSWIAQTGARGAKLRRALARRRARNQTIAVAAILAAAVIAAIRQPQTFY